MVFQGFFFLNAQFTWDEMICLEIEMTDGPLALGKHYCSVDRNVVTTLIWRADDMMSEI